MTRITHPTNIHFRYPQPPTHTLTPQSQPEPQGVKHLQATMNASDGTASALQSGTSPDTPLLHPYLTQAYTVLVQAHRQHSKHLASQGRQAALNMLTEGRFTKPHIMDTLAKYAHIPQALAGFFTALGPQNTLNAVHQVDHQNSDLIGPSGYAPFVDPTTSRLWTGKGHLQAIHPLEARYRDQVRAQQKTLADALSQALAGGLSDAFIQELAHTASSTTRGANQLSQLLAQSDDAALVPLKEALYNHLMAPEKALSPISDADTRGWVRAATLLLGDNPSAYWLEPLQDAVGSVELSQFITTAVQHTANIRGLDGMPYGDEDYQRGLAGLLSGLSQLQGEAYTGLKAHVFSVACDAMGETHTREELTEGLKTLFVSDPKRIAMEIINNSNHFVSSPTAFSFFFKEAIFNNPDPKGEFVEAVSSTLKDLYQEATDGSLSESDNENSSMTLGVLFGSLRAAFNDAKADNKADQEAVRNIVNVLTGFATIYPGISTQLSAVKDGIVVPVFSDLFNSSNRMQAEKMNLIDDKFHEILRVMLAGLNGYKQETGRSIKSEFSSAFALTHDEGTNILRKI